MTEKIFDHTSEEFDSTLNIALKDVAAKRNNPNKSFEATYHGYCNAVDRIGKDLAEAARGTLRKSGWSV